MPTNKFFNWVTSFFYWFILFFILLRNFLFNLYNLRFISILFTHTFNLLLCSKESIDLQIIHIMLWYLIVFLELFSFLLNIRHKNNTSFSNWINLSDNPSRFHRNKFLLIELHNFKSYFVFRLAKSRVPQTQPLFIFQFIYHYPLVLLMYIELICIFVS